MSGNIHGSEVSHKIQPGFLQQRARGLAGPELYETIGCGGGGKSLTNQGFLCLSPIGIENPRAATRLGRAARERDGLNVEGFEREQLRYTWLDQFGFVRRIFLTSDESVCWGFGVRIVSAGKAVTGEIRLGGQDVDACVVGLEKGAEFVEILLSQRVELMIMTLRAIEGQAHEPFAHMLDGLLEPLIAIKEKVVAGEITGSAQFL